MIFQCACGDVLSDLLFERLADPLDLPQASFPGQRFYIFLRLLNLPRHVPIGIALERTLTGKLQQQRDLFQQRHNFLIRHRSAST